MVRRTLVVEKLQEGVLFQRYFYGQWKWFKDGNEKTDQKYAGEIRNGVPYRQGIYTHPDGSKYEGEIKDGKFNGQGTFTHPDGAQRIGEWKNGVFWNGKVYDKYGNFIGRVVNGGWQ